MAKKRAESRKQRRPTVTPHRPQDSDDEVEAAIERLEEYYRMGQDSLAEADERVPYGSSSELLRKARVFAGRYTEAELRKLVEKCRTQHMALGRSLVDRVATVHDKRKRGGLETRVIQERWSLNMLNREIRGRFGRRRRCGRKPYTPKNRAEALSELTRLSMKLTRWGEAMDLIDSTGQVKADPENEVVALLPDSVVEKLKAALSAVWELQEAAEAELGE